MEEQRPNKDGINSQLESLIGSRSHDDPTVTPLTTVAAQVNTKFDEVAKLLDDRLNQLNDALPQAEKVTAECDAIRDWTKDAQERLDALEAMPSNKSDIQDKLDKLKVLKKRDVCLSPFVTVWC